MAAWKTCSMTLAVLVLGVNGADGDADAAGAETSDDACVDCDWTNIAKGCLWFCMIAMMFFAQHHVCDAYFVPAINVFVRKMKHSPSPALQRWGEEAVAGATICALGCNGPELFSNLIALFTHSDAGIGVVVGSEIFNLLIIVGAATLCAPIVPLRLEKAPFIRDVIFYGLSIALLYWALMDKKIQFYEACVLLGAAAVYVVTVYFTSDLANKFGGKEEEIEDAAEEGGDKKTGKMHGIEVEVEEVIHSRMADAHMQSSTKFNLDPTEAGIYAEQIDDHHGGDAFRRTNTMGRASVGFQFEGGDGMLGSMLRYKHLKEVQVVAEGVILLEFAPNLFQHITLKITVPSSEKRDELLERIKEYSLGRTWVHNYDAGPVEALRHFTHAIQDKDAGLLAKLLHIPEVIIDIMLRATLCCVDVKDINKEGRWPLCFLGAMMWLAFFSFAMLEIANFIHYNMPFLPISFLGITVCAIGTSFPNAVASILMAKQNKPAAAIANALGSNVQNVFLAMALPWIIYSAAQLGCGDIDQDVNGINEGVVWMVGTLLLLVLFAMMPASYTLVKWQGVVLAVSYLGYLALVSLEAFHKINPLIN